MDDLRLRQRRKKKQIKKNTNQGERTEKHRENTVGPATQKKIDTVTLLGIDSRTHHHEPKSKIYIGLMFYDNCV